MIDVWAVDTFDRGLRDDLEAHDDFIRDYVLAQRRRRAMAPAPGYRP